ncbi:MAG: ABC transporter permease, partial [Spirochaetales bacterium]|nr:ABC transporter permease [Spirochaetales bacterium]
MIEGRMYQVAVTALVRIAARGMVPGLSLNTPAGGGLLPLSEDSLPVRFKTDYYFGGPDFGAMDYVAPVYIAFLVLFFVFLITCVSLIQERTRGTMERLAATPATRVEIILGYFIGLGVYALMQGALILVFSLFVLKTVYSGSLLLLFLIIILLAIVGVALGMLASSFARNEFQVVQFIPLLIIPQMLLGGTVVPVDELPAILKPLAYSMPLTYANIALRDVMIKGWGLRQIYEQLIILCGFAVILILLDVVALKRRIE